VNSYHIHLNTFGFHRYGKEISQNCPCSLHPINTTFLGTLRSSCHPASSIPPSWRWHCSRNSRTPARISSNDSSSPQSLPPFRKKWPSTSSSLMSIQHYLSLFYRTFGFCTVIYLVFSPFIFSVFPTFNPLGIGRENCHPH